MCRSQDGEERRRQGLSHSPQVQEQGREFLAKTSRVFRGGDRQGKLRGSGHPDLHLRHHRGAQGGDAHPQQLHAPDPHAPEAHRYPTKGDIFLSVLPVWHSYERAIGYVAIFAGCSMAYSKPVAQIMVEDMGKIKPQIFPSVPRIWEAVKKGIIRNIESGSSVKKALAYFFLGVGTAHSKLKVRLPGSAGRVSRGPAASWMP